MLLQLTGAARFQFFGVYAILVASAGVVVFVIYPFRSASKPQRRIPIPGCRWQCSRGYTKPHALGRPMRQALRRLDLWLFAGMFAWISLINGYTTGAIPDLLAQYATNDDQAIRALYTNYIFPLVSNASFVVAPLVGLLIDRVGFVPVIGLCILVTQLYLGALLVENLRFQLVSFILYAMEQALLYTLQFSYILIEFPAELYGSLQTVLTLGSFAMTCQMYWLNPMTQYTYDGNYTPAFIILILPTALMYGFPVFLQMTKRSRPAIAEDTLLVARC